MPRTSKLPDLHRPRVPNKQGVNCAIPGRWLAGTECEQGGRWTLRPRASQLLVTDAQEIDVARPCPVCREEAICCCLVGRCIIASDCSRSLVRSVRFWTQGENFQIL